MNEVPKPVAETSHETNKEPNKKGGVGCLVVIAVLLAVGIYSCTRPIEPTPKPGIIRPNGERVDEFMAAVRCESKIKDLLKAPSTAKFGRATKTLSDNQWRLVIPVDAQNSFGAMLRSNWTCILNGNDDTIYVNQD